MIAKFGTWVHGEPRVNKIETHIQPIADAADHVDYVNAGPVSDQTTGITYHSIEKSRFKLITLIKQFLVALKLAWANDYDLVVSYSLPPYGVFALIIKYLTRTPAHLGIIGADLDVHANAWYSPLIVWLFRRFDVVSVAGREYEERLQELGVPEERIYSVLHPVSNEFAEVSVVEEPAYDILWLTRMSSEKNPLLFVEILAELRDRSVPFSAAMVGSGPMDDEVADAITEHGLDEMVDTPGWTDNPVEYYRNARIYVLTSDREMLPLTLVEAMFVGLPSVAPRRGGIPDIVQNHESGFVIEETSVELYANRIEQLLTDDELHQLLATNAQTVTSKLSNEAVSKTWSDIFGYVESEVRSSS